MSEKPTTKPLDDEAARVGDATDWELLRGMSDEEAEARARRDPDAPPTDKQFWRSAKLSVPSGRTKVALYLDDDILAWFKKQGRDYQDRLNEALRAHVNRHRPAKAHG